jgi:hypothetical protein
MTQMKRKMVMQYGAVANVMSHLSSLPEREKSSGDLISLSDIFRTKEYISEINGALKKGYSFDDLAEIFTEKCGVAISARQMKYHYTRRKNQALKKKSIPETQSEGLANNPVSLDKSHQEEKEIGATTLTDSWEQFLTKSSNIVSGDDGRI